MGSNSSLGTKINDDSNPPNQVPRLTLKTNGTLVFEEQAIIDGFC